MESLECGKRLIIAILLLSYASVSRTQVCYTPAGQTLADYGICDPKADGSLCCGVGDKCFNNNLCQATDLAFYRGGCTDHAATFCPVFCTSSSFQYFPPSVPPTSSGGAAFHVAQCNNTESLWYCCDGDKNGACCNDPKNDLFLAEATIATIARSTTPSTQSGFPSAPTSSATSNTTTSQQTMSGSQTLLSPIGTDTTAAVSSLSASLTSSPAPYPSSPTAAPVPKVSKHSNHTVILGSSISLSIAAVLLGCGVFACFWIRRSPPQESQRRRHQQHKDPEKQGNRTADGIRASEAATTSDEGGSTLIDSHGQTSTPSLNTNNAIRDAVELGSSTIHQLASMPSPRLAPSPMSQSDNYSHPSLAPSPLSTQVRDIPPQSYSTPLISPLGLPPTSRSAYRTAELESAFDVAPIHPRFRPPSPSPASIELEARDGVTISTLYNVASGSPRNQHGFRPAPPTHGSPLSMILQSPHSSTFPREESEAGSRVELPGSSGVVGELEGSSDERRPPTPAKPTENWAPQAQAATGSVSSDVQGQTEGRRNSGEMGDGSQYREGGRNGYRALDSERQPDSPSSVLEGEARNWANWF